MTAESLFQAVKEGDLAGAMAILGRDPDLLEARDSDGLSPVLLATYYGRREILKDLLGRGPHLTAFEAAAAGVLERVRQALEEDASLA
ncbi:MAG: ankyrin repeat domain-containing protein, partial [Anaerolineales bacterium]